MSKRMLVAVSDEYVRDSQRFNGSKEDAMSDSIHDSDDWVDVCGAVLVGDFNYDDDEELAKKKEEFEWRYPNFTLEYIEVVC